MHLEIRHGDGVRVFDHAGRDWIDCTSGGSNLPLGYTHPRIVDIYSRHANGPLGNGTQSPDTALLEETIAQLEARLRQYSPIRDPKIFLHSCSGTTAIEGAIRLALTNRPSGTVVSFLTARLGQEFSAMRISDSKAPTTALPGVAMRSAQIPPPDCSRCQSRLTPGSCDNRCVSQIEDRLQSTLSGDVGAIIAELVLSGGENIVWPRATAAGLREVCSRMALPLIINELHSGIGRTGAMFATDLYDIEPDILILGKGLGGHGAKVSAIIADASFAGLDPGIPPLLDSGNSIAAQTALETIAIVSQHDFLANVRKVGLHLRDGLQRHFVSRQYVRDVRGVGLMIGLDLQQSDSVATAHRTRIMIEEGMNCGLILRGSRYGHGNVLEIRPPLITTCQEADEILERLEKAFARATRRRDW